VIALGGFRGLSIRWRLTVWYLGVLTLVLAVFGAAIYTLQAKSSRAELIGRVRAQHQRLAATYDPADRLLHPIEAQSPVDNDKLKILSASEREKVLVERKIAVGPDGIAMLVNADGVAIPQFGNLAKEDAANIARAARKLAVAPKPEPTFDYPPLSWLSGAYVFYTALVPDPASRGTLLVFGLPDDSAERLRDLVTALLLSAPLTLLVAADGGYWLASRALRPVQAITHTAQTISGTDLHRRLNLNSSDELGQLAGTFDQMLERLEAAFVRQRQFTADASHELRTPLAVVQLEVERALACAGLPPSVAGSLSTIQVESVYMARLVDNLLTLARADAGRHSSSRGRWTWATWRWRSSNAWRHWRVSRGWK
jgi:signal transduction histidine kinase